MKPRERNYRIYGITLRSSFPFGTHLERGGLRADLRFRYRGIREGYVPSGEKKNRVEGDQGVMDLYLSPEGETIFYPGIAAFHCASDTIEAIGLNPRTEYLLEICLLGNVLSYWLERRGIIMLHSSSVEIGGKAVAFVAGTHRGKTTTACSFIKEGFPLVSDDILPLHLDGNRVMASPGFPQMKLLPEHLALLERSPDDYEKIHPFYEKKRVPIGGDLGRYCHRELELGGIYLIDHIDSGLPVSALPLNPAEALMTLVRHSFVAELLDRIDRGKPRLDKLAAIAKGVPMKRLQIPRGYENFPRMVEFVIGDRTQS